MSSTTNQRRWWLAATTMLLAAGCGSPTAQVSGHAEFADGTPLTGAVRKLSFEPTPDSTAEVRKAAMGDIGTDGAFTLYTRKPGDGVFKGKYAVTFTVLKDPNYGGLLVPEKYADKGSTPFIVEVTADRDDLHFQLDKE